MRKTVEFGGKSVTCCQPFLKWPGGKRWLAPKIAKMIGDIEGTYYEPFLGGGAVFFYIRPTKAVLSDCNLRLMQIYGQVKYHVEDVIAALGGLRPSKRLFREYRELRPRSYLARTVQFLYLNRTAFNGMYRVNQNGQFNVPYGCKKGTKVCDEQVLRTASAALTNAELLSGDFEATIDMAGEGDFLYCDPPFTVKHDNNGFIRYNESLFSWADQERLAIACRRASQRGAAVIVSNAHHKQIRDLYTDFDSHVVKRHSLISGPPNGRGNVSEYLFVGQHEGKL